MIANGRPVGFRETGEGLEGANRKKNQSKNLKNQNFFRFFFSIGTALELTLHPFKF